MIYRCQACGRRLLEPAYTAPAGLGSWMLGPVCHEKERRAGRLPMSGRGEIRSQPRKPAAKRVKIKRIKRAPQVQEDLFWNGVENVGEVD